MPSDSPRPEPVDEVVSDSPWPAHMPVVHASSGAFAMMTAQTAGKT